MKLPGGPGPRIAAILFGAWIGAGGTALNAGVQEILVSDDNAQAVINPAAGITSWTIDGINHLALQSIWYRIGEIGPERSLDSLAYSGASQPFPDQATLSWSGDEFDLQIQYGLTGGNPGSGVSDLAEAIRITNTSASALDFHLFLYTDFDMAGTSGGDTVSMSYLSGPPAIAGYDRAVQTDGANLAEVTVLEQSNRAEAEPWAVTLFKLTDSDADDLAAEGMSIGPTGPDDVTFAFQWDFGVEVGSSETLTVDKRMDVVPIPEPGAGHLTLLGALLLAGLRGWKGPAGAVWKPLTAQERA